MSVVFAITLMACTVTLSLSICFIGRNADLQSVWAFVVCLLLGLVVPVGVFRSTKPGLCHKASAGPFLGRPQA